MPYYYFYGFDPAYLLLIVVSTILGMAAQGYIRSTYRKWSNVPASSGMTGAQVARRMLDEGGASSVGITEIGGTLTDNFDPRDNKLHLSQENFSEGSVASVAVACHEAGHACQKAKGYVPMKVRTALVPVVNFATNAWTVVLLLGIFMGLAGFVRLALILFAFSVIFELVTLPVEIDASRCAVKYLAANGGGIDEKGAKQVLTAAALTYVAAALVSILQLVYLMGRYNDRN
jgi:Zn-dependent membrane protease YugP